MDAETFAVIQDVFPTPVEGPTHAPRIVAIPYSTMQMQLVRAHSQDPASTHERAEVRAATTWSTALRRELGHENARRPRVSVE